MAVKEQLTKKERREAAREKARKAAELEAKRQKRNKMITIGVVVAAIVLIAVVIWAIVSNSSGSKNGGVEYLEYETPLVEVAPVNDPETGNQTGFALTSTTTDVAADAPTINLYFDYMCVHCNTLERDRGGELAKMVDEGRATVVLNPVAIMGTQYSANAAAAFEYVAKNSPEHLFKFHMNLFEYSDDMFSGRSSTEPGWDQVLAAASDAGVPQDVIDGMQDGLDMNWLQTATTDFRAQYQGTPTVLLNGTEDYSWATQGFLGMVGLEPIIAEQG